jgi:hypothetical protein
MLMKQAVFTLGILALLCASGPVLARVESGGKTATPGAIRCVKTDAHLAADCAKPAEQKVLLARHIKKNRHPWLHAHSMKTSAASDSVRRFNKPPKATKGR